ncbi:hypothetical protein GH714_021029 [Hevea brasiliensis]|uniref:Leucine-rich repeat-containing N-terminal plant-type domain-containing protein n=1 Tax=Hevea brasiliensis TaxID=3981 RepID=A0A6A6KRV1_HEVBR|nr:hypothetical protein GH714_021029 [Hevea brasiliensis]
MERHRLPQSTSHVTELDLHFNETTDKPLRVPVDNNGSHYNLRYLDLSNANFAGTISSVLANLSSLQSLRLSHNHFHDLGNTEWLHGLSSLSFLHLSGNPLLGPMIGCK